jgi:hypothetical protein
VYAGIFICVEKLFIFDGAVFTCGQPTAHNMEDKHTAMYYQSRQIILECTVDPSKLYGEASTLYHYTTPISSFIPTTLYLAIISIHILLVSISIITILPLTPLRNLTPDYSQVHSTTYHKPPLNRPARIPKVDVDSPKA